MECFSRNPKAPLADFSGGDCPVALAPDLGRVKQMIFSCQEPVGSLRLQPFPLWPAAVAWNVEVCRAVEGVASALLSVRISGCPWYCQQLSLDPGAECVCDLRQTSLVGFHWVGHLLDMSAGSKDSLCVPLAHRMAAPQGRACASGLPPMVHRGSAPQVLGFLAGRRVEFGVVLAPLGLELPLTGFLRLSPLGW